ncbi:ATP-binding protein [Streptomyces sp. Go40/10]|uniref:ATP-binding protein n=1 Tax=Streptomyces sp. Go40/10 TaxID=2825844 RepID=UPI001E65971D|nr:ATP-binding protein [Streptomyces sp. Go40/10]UFR03849.1 ATP-binding protein [Streptomyces sp. Go40/10]
MPSTETFRIPTRSHHVPTARHYVRKALADWGITDDLADRAVLSANELVTNAVTHCLVSSARVRVTLLLVGSELVLEVSDPDRDRLPRLRDPGPDEEGGRGLALVEALADTWGHRQEPYTKTVWARFTLAPEEVAGVPDRA